MITQELLQDRLGKLQRGFTQIEQKIVHINQQMTQLAEARLAQIGAISELQDLLKMFAESEVQAQKSERAAEQGIGPALNDKVVEKELEVGIPDKE